VGGERFSVERWGVKLQSRSQSARKSFRRKRKKGVPKGGGKRNGCVSGRRKGREKRSGGRKRRETCTTAKSRKPKVEGQGKERGGGFYRHVDRGGKKGKDQEKKRGLFMIRTQQ